MEPELLVSGYDSDNGVDEAWRVDRADRLLDEFEDVTLTEKAFMKLWNRWVVLHPLQGDRTVPAACWNFVHAARKFGRWRSLNARRGETTCNEAFIGEGPSRAATIPGPAAQPPHPPLPLLG